MSVVWKLTLWLHTVKKFLDFNAPSICIKNLKGSAYTVFIGFSIIFMVAVAVYCSAPNILMEDIVASNNVYAPETPPEADPSDGSEARRVPLPMKPNHWATAEGFFLGTLFFSALAPVKAWNLLQYLKSAIFKTPAAYYYPLPVRNVFGDNFVPYSGPWWVLMLALGIGTVYAVYSVSKFAMTGTGFFKKDNTANNNEKEGVVPVSVETTSDIV